MIRTEEAAVNKGWFTVHVDAGDLDCGNKLLPYPTCIGVIRPDGRVSVWTPAASVPRGYRVAAEAVLLAEAAKVLPEGVRIRSVR